MLADPSAPDEMCTFVSGVGPPEHSLQKVVERTLIGELIGDVPCQPVLQRSVSNEIKLECGCAFTEIEGVKPDPHKVWTRA